MLKRTKIAIISLSSAILMLSAFAMDPPVQRSITSLSQLYTSTVIRVPQDFPTIQEAIQNANPGNIIEVDGTQEPYIGSIEINKSLMLSSVNGRAIIEHVDRKAAVITITSDLVQIHGFEVRGGLAGIFLDKSTENTVKDNILKNNFAGVMLLGSKNNMIEKNTVEDNVYGIWGIGSTENRLEKNTARKNTTAGIQFGGASDNNEVKSNTVEDNTLGIGLVGGSSGNKVETNIAQGNSAAGIQVQDSNGNVVRQNTLQHNGTGVTIIGASGNRIEENAISGRSFNGIQLVNSRDNILKANTIENGQFGIGTLRSDGNYIEENEVINNNFGIQLTDSSSNVLEHNAVMSQKFDGVILESSSENNTLRNNTVESNQRFGIRIGNSRGNLLEDNIFKRNIQGGILIQRSSVENIVKNNKSVSNTSAFGITIEDSNGNLLETNLTTSNEVGIQLRNANENTLDGNQAQGNNSVGIELKNSARNRLTNNVAMDNGDGFLLKDSDDNVLTANQAEQEDVGFTLDRSDRNILETNEARNNAIGFDVREGEDNALRANIAEGNEIGILVDNSVGTVRDGNTAVNNLIANVKLLDLVEGELLVRFKKEGVSQQLIDIVIKKHSTEVIDFFPSIQVYHLRIIDGADADATRKKVDEFNQEGAVDTAELNIRFQIASTPVPPDDGAFPEQWNLQDGRGGIGITRAWELGYTDSSDTVIAVIDTGIDLGHLDLQGNLLRNEDEEDRPVLGYDFVQGKTLEDRIGHGTFVAGIIGAEGNNGYGIAGISWKASILSLKVADDLTIREILEKVVLDFAQSLSGTAKESDLFRAMQVAIAMKAGINQIPSTFKIPESIKQFLEKNGPLNLRVLSFSGTVRQGVIGEEKLVFMKDMIEELGRLGILFVTAAGNDNKEITSEENRKVFPCSFNDPTDPESNIICVGASTEGDSIAVFPDWGSNWGKDAVDLVAPGVDIVSLFANETTPAGCKSLHGFTDLGLCNGTSFSVAHVSGMAALLFSLCPQATPQLIKQLILNNVEPVELDNPFTLNVVEQVASGGRLKWPDEDKLRERGCQSPQ